MTEETFIKGMFKLASGYPDVSLTQPTIEAYRDRLWGLTDKEFEVAVDNCLDTCKWFPKIAELKGVVLALRNQGRPTAAERWGQLIIAAERGEGGPTDPATVRALQVCGGWEAFNRMEYKDLDFRRRDFERVYTEVLEAEDRGALLGLEGLQKQLER